jgi:hypothetical protein
LGWSQLLEASIAAHAPAVGNVSLANAVSTWWTNAEAQMNMRKGRSLVPLHIQLDEAIGSCTETEA